ncbi:MAG: hypothetical protein FCKEOINB_02816 [Nitrosomonas sp.]|nr:hypothetical protein [Nitrosomonas sp.]
MTAARAFSMEGMYRAVFHRRDGIFQITAFVDRVGMNGNLHIVFVRDSQAVIDGCKSGSPVLVQFQSARAGQHLLLQRRRQTGVALAEESGIHDQSVGSSEHRMDVPRTGRTGGGGCSNRGPGAAAQHGGNAVHHRVFGLLRRNEVDMRIYAAGGHNQIFTGDDFGRRTDGHRYIGLNIGISGFADIGDFAVLDADVRFDDSPMIDNDRIGDHGIHDVRMAALRLSHAVAYHFSAAEFYFLAIGGEVSFNLDEKFGIGQTDTVAGCRPHHFRIGLAGNFYTHFLTPVKSLRTKLFQFAHHFLIESIHDPVTRELDQLDGSLLSGLEADGRARHDIQAHAIRRVAVKFHGGVDFVKMKVGTDLDRTIPAIGNGQGFGFSAGIQLDFTRFGKHFAWNHGYSHGILLLLIR